MYLSWRINPFQDNQTMYNLRNGQRWKVGWDDNVLGEEHLIDENGALPGHCGVEDCLVRNQIGGYYTTDVSKTLNEQIVLGFAQYALYNHLKWKEILVPSERSVYYPSLNEYRNKYAADDTSNIDEDGQIDQAWYWWKMIPRGLCLPERLISTFRQMIVSFEDKQHEGVCQKHPKSWKEYYLMIFGLILMKHMLNLYKSHIYFI